MAILIVVAEADCTGRYCGGIVDPRNGAVLYESLGMFDERQAALDDAIGEMQGSAFRMYDYEVHLNTEGALGLP